MIGLHRGLYALRGEARNLRAAEVLGVLDLETAVTRAVDLRDAVEHIEDPRVGVIADGVDDHLQSRRVRLPDPGPQRVDVGDLESPGIGRVAEGLEEPRGGRAE